MLLTVREVAERLRISIGSVYAAIEDGRLKAYRLGRGGALRISEENLRSFLESCAVENSEEPKPARTYRHLKV